MVLSVGAKAGLRQIGALPSDSSLPQMVRPVVEGLLAEVRELEQRIAGIELQLAQVSKHSDACQRLLSVPGIGLLSATAIVAATSGSVSHFKSARHFAAWLGLTPKEHSSGASRHLGRITKRGDKYLRMLLTHGARSVLNAARMAQRRRHSLDPLRTWAMGLTKRSHHNKATCALANKLARICFAVLRSLQPYASGRLTQLQVA